MTATALAALITVGISVLGAFVMLLMVNYLPDSPIQSFIASANGFWQYCNGLAFFLPIAEMLSILEVWFDCLINSGAYFIKEYIKSRTWKLHKKEEK